MIVCFFLGGGGVIEFFQILLKRTNVVYRFIYPFRECLPKTSYSYIGYTTTSLSRGLTKQLLANSPMNQH